MCTPNHYFVLSTHAVLPAKPATITYLDDATYARLRNQGWQGLPQQRSQRYLQNRVSYSYLDEDGDDLTLSDRHYSYDAHGNVEWLVQDVPNLGKKHLRYAYDLLSGNVRQVYYQEGQADAFYHRYEYDADNRLLGVETSTDAYHWEQDAAYHYYAHGPCEEWNWAMIKCRAWTTPTPFTAG